MSVGWCRSLSLFCSLRACHYFVHDCHFWCACNRVLISHSLGCAFEVHSVHMLSLVIFLETNWIVFRVICWVKVHKQRLWTLTGLQLIGYIGPLNEVPFAVIMVMLHQIQLNKSTNIQELRICMEIHSGPYLALT